MDSSGSSVGGASLTCGVRGWCGEAASGRGWRGRGGRRARAAGARRRAGLGRAGLEQREAQLVGVSRGKGVHAAPGTAKAGSPAAACGPSLQRFKHLDSRQRRGRRVCVRRAAVAAGCCRRRQDGLGSKAGGRACGRDGQEVPGVAPAPSTSTKTSTCGHSTQQAAPAEAAYLHHLSRRRRPAAAAPAAAAPHPPHPPNSCRQSASQREADEELGPASAAASNPAKQTGLLRPGSEVAQWVSPAWQRRQGGGAAHSLLHGAFRTLPAAIIHS